jgi:hypothetical protein
MLRSSVVDVSGLKPDIRRDMYALFERYYDETSRARFEADLAGKDAAFIVRDDEGNLCGFSTLASERYDGLAVPTGFRQRCPEIVEEQWIRLRVRDRPLMTCDCALELLQLGQRIAKVGPDTRPMRIEGKSITVAPNGI